MQEHAQTPEKPVHHAFNMKMLRMNVGNVQ
jgi:hypothetical protein